MALSPGFANPVHDAQQSFRQLLEALSRPGQIRTLPASLTPPTGLTPACAAACLTLLDLETTVWLWPDCPPAVNTWLAFHTGVRRSPNPASAGFAVLDLTVEAPLPDLAQFSIGTPTDPESACTLLLQIPDLVNGPPVRLQGPGIPNTQTIAPQIPNGFWHWWAQNHAQYPLGTDVFLFSFRQVMGLPRSVMAEPLAEERPHAIGGKSAWQ